MLKSYDELRAIDVKPYCETRKEGKEAIQYLNWAKCIDLLHKNGAEKVYFTPVEGENGTSLIMTNKVFKDGNDNTNSVYETKIHVVIDDLEFDFQGPVMNGANPVKDNSMSQQRLWNSQTRLFVKAVAIHTGLGFDLWLKNEEVERSVQRESDIHHNIMSVRERVLQNFTTLNKRGLTKAQIAEELGTTEEELDMKFKMYGTLATMEQRLLDAIKKYDK